MIAPAADFADWINIGFHLVIFIAIVVVLMLLLTLFDGRR
jgi:hypothetical protein